MRGSAKQGREYAKSDLNVRMAVQTCMQKQNVT